MRFSLYSELQLHPGKSAEQLYAEALEQMVNADRLGYDTYAVIEHYFFPKFSVSANPTALFAAAAQRTRDIRFRTMLHALPYHNPTVLASVIHTTHILTGGRYEWGVGRGHGWIPEKAGVRLDEHARPRYEEAVDLLLAALDNERFSHHGEYFDVDDSHVVPFVDTPYRVYLGGTSDRTYTLAAERGWGVAVPPLLPYKVLEQQLDLYRSSCAEHGTKPDIVWIHACHLDEDRETAFREAPRLDQRLHPGQLLAADGVGEAAHRGANRRRLRVLHRRDHGAARRGAVRAADRGRLRLGRHARRHRRADRGDAAVCEGVEEIGITVNGGGAPHWMAIKNQELFAEQVVPHFEGRVAVAARA